jgi:hypothetical protein
MARRLPLGNILDGARRSLVRQVKQAHDGAEMPLGLLARQAVTGMGTDRAEEHSLAAEEPSEPHENLTLPAIAEKADDLVEIKKSVEDAASVSGGLWLSYLFVLSYIAIAAGAVTHEDLLLVRPVKLPFLNVELPLKAFFALAPFLAASSDPASV